MECVMNEWCWGCMCTHAKERTIEEIIASNLPSIRKKKDNVSSNDAVVPTLPESKYYYFMTLTTPPNKLTAYDLRDHLSKILKSKMISPKYWMACMELTKERVPHIHCLLCVDKYIDKSKIKYPYRLDLQIAERPSAVNKYLCKSKMSDIEYCDKLGIPQIWSSDEKESHVPAASVCVDPQ